MWQKYEDDYMQDIENFVKNQEGNKEIRINLPGRSEEECQLRRRERRSEGHEPKTEDQIPLYKNDWIYFQPQGLNEIPLLPFLNICKFLPYQQVFRILPLVCRHFRQLIQGYQIPINSVDIINPTHPELTLTMLARKVVDCNQMVLARQPKVKNLKLWGFLAENLINKFQNSLRELSYESDWCRNFLEHRKMWSNISRLKIVLTTHRERRFSGLTLVPGGCFYYNQAIMECMDQFLLRQLTDSLLESNTFSWYIVKGRERDAIGMLRSEELCLLRLKLLRNFQTIETWEELITSIHDDHSLTDFLAVCQQARSLETLTVSLTEDAFIIGSAKKWSAFISSLRQSRRLSLVRITTVNFQSSDPYIPIVKSMLLELPKGISGITFQGVFLRRNGINQ
jgi:hypothetical protein